MKSQLKNIVCFALPAWEAEYLRSTVELMKGASVSAKVLYVDYAYTIVDCLNGISGRKKFDWKRCLGLKKRLRQAEGYPNLYILSLPPVLPVFGTKNYRLYRLLNKINGLITGYFINRAIAKLGMAEVTGFNSFQPFLGNYWDIPNLRYMVYYLYDDFSQVPRFRAFREIEEANFLHKVDLIVVSSDELKRRHQLTGKPIETIYNGVHFYSFFDQRNNKKLNGNYIKTVGYTGTIDSRLDLDLLEQVIERMPAIRFLFAGKVSDATIRQRLSRFINVSFAPPVPAALVPQVQSQIHAGIIPYLCNEQNAAIYPLKINEFLAMGLPVVMTPFAAVAEALDVVYTAATADQFIKSLEKALLENTPAMIEQRISIARRADWQLRADQLLEAIDKHQTNKNTQPL